MRKSIKKTINKNKKNSRKHIYLYGGSKCNDLKSHSLEEYRKLCEYNSNYCVWCKTYCRNRTLYKDDNFEISYPKGIKSSVSAVSRPAFLSTKSPIIKVSKTKGASIKLPVVSKGNSEAVPIVSGEQKKFRLSDIVKVPGDGTCFFHSIVFGLKTLGLYEGTGHRLRQEVAQYLKDVLDNGNNLDVAYQSGISFSGSQENNLSFRDYLFAMGYVPEGGNAEKFMREYISAISKNKWGTEIELWAVAKMFPRINFEVYSKPKGTEFLRQTSGGRETNNPRYPTIRIYNEAGDNPEGKHYDALPASRPLQ
jgi:hypothetical protein